MGRTGGPFEIVGEAKAYLIVSGGNGILESGTKK